MNKNLLTLAFAGTILVGCGTTKTTVSDLAIKNPIETALDLTKTINDKVPVTINPGRFATDKVTYRLPRVVQGTYSVSDFGKYIDNFKAIDYKGNELTVTKVDTNTWDITNAKELDKITYLVNDTFDIEKEGGIGKETPFSPSGTNIEATNYVLNLHGFIGYFDSLKNSQYKLDIISPANFVKTSALQEVKSITTNDNKIITNYFAPRYFDITDNPMFYGELDVEEFKVGDIKIVLSVFSPNKVHTAEKIKVVMEKMMQAQKAYLGNVNSTTRYDIYLYLSEGKETSPKGFGALEHHTSTVVVLPESMSDERLAETMTDVVSHEFFHIISPLSVHSEDVHSFDYNQPTFSKHLWMYEGVTEYFATLFQVKEGLVSEKQFYETIMSKVKNASEMDDTMSFTVMSENILEEKYHDQYTNVYQKGALISMCIDLLLREESNGTRGILSLMKELSTKYGKNKPFEDDNLIHEISTMTYPSVANFLNTHVIGTTPIDYNVFFEKAGLKVGKQKIKTNYLQNNGQNIVTADPITRSIIFTDAVGGNSFWSDNGAKSGDIIKNINGKEVTLATVNDVLSKVFLWKPGTEANVVLVRNGKEVIIKTTTTQSYTTGNGLTQKPNVTAKQKELKAAWLKG